MSKRSPFTLWICTLAVLLLTASAAAAQITFTDPTGDDNGPGEYVYPTDAVYTRGSFDITELSVDAKGKNVDFNVSVNSNLENPWGMDNGFSVQMVWIFIDTDGKEGSGFTTAPPGVNVQFAPASAWDKLVILSPQASARVKEEVGSKAEAMADAIIVPRRVTGSGRTISGKVKVKDIGEGDPATWGYQVVMQSNEGFPAENDLLTRRVNEFEGQHRFGG
ncbi:MAG: glucodextranase DOMON-like domain-containing protein, partial [Pseudomonadota bacterium]